MALLEARGEHNSQSSVARNGNTQAVNGRREGRRARRSVVKLSIISLNQQDHAPVPGHRARAIRIAERNRKRRLLPRRDPQQRNTTIDTLLDGFSHSCAPIRTFIGPRPAHLHMPLRCRVGSKVQFRLNSRRAKLTHVFRRPEI